jgi:septal ring factor EnvC (AmiA/AmiB activator)
MHRAFFYIQFPNDHQKKKMAAIQLDNSNYSKTQARLETQLYAQEQDMSKLRKEIQQLTKAKRDAEKKLITEVSIN